MAWDEWERIKGEVAGTGGSGGMRLNSAPGGGGGGGGDGDLRVSQQELAAIGGHAFQLFQRLGKEGRGPVAATLAAARDLSGQEFALGGALQRVQERWGQQVRSLVDACGHISNGLDAAQKIHRSDEHFVARTVSSIAQLTTAFDEEAERRR
ncbi:hypothetical protein OG897_20505 [Streptomyces sp. NBC_00237]|uniref:hypothetical protein n=1 Tax=Streptomyces sp. NBC_00237 TaxID=2975687 RepID=UPI002250A67A|nr:hypothetical protein [Streptomyces sp. NBC_00237]MCX5203825.1 hypothetical protein [Streptomyces sp. NBC_00237]